jgi:transcriptional regulator with XRE-family HTH domain
VRLPCLLRHARGDRTLSDLARAADVGGLTVAELSKIERGIQLPRDAWKAALETVYGIPPHEWYPPEVLLVVERDEEQT